MKKTVPKLSQMTAKIFKLLFYKESVGGADGTRTGSTIFIGMNGAE